MPSPGSPSEEQVRQLEAAIEAQEALRPTLGDAVVDTALAALRARLENIRSAPVSPKPPSPSRSVPPGLYTVLFADLAGFTALSEELDPDEVREFLNDLMLELSEAVEQYGGLIAKFLGDAVVAVFHGRSAEHPSESETSDVERALLAALLMEARVQDLDRAWRDRLGREVRLHMGVEAGGRESVSETSTADAISTATRLQNWAGPGEIYVGPGAYALTRSRFRYASHPVPEPAREGLQAYGLLGAGSARATAASSLRRSEDTSAALDSGQLTHDAELRQATVVFADLAAPARARRALSGVELDAFQQDLMHVLAEAVDRYGGTVERIFGNAVMAMFGAPIAHEDDPERAVRSAVLMRDLADGLARRWQSRLGIEIALQVGINTGTVVAGGIALGAGQAYAVTGDTLNTAARLRSAARPGEILLGPDTMRLVSHVAELEALPPISLKGKSRPVQAYRLQELRSERAPNRGLHQRGIASALVGRDAELRAIREALQRLRDGEGGMLAITGEPGLGKSRLFAEARAQRDPAEVQWLEGRALSYSTELSHWPFLQILRQAAGIEERHEESEAWARLERRLHTLFGGDITEPLAYLAAMLGLELTGDLAERVRYLDAEALRRQVFRAARRFFEQLAREKPLVLFLEDLHWVDGSSAALLEHLLPLTAEVPLLLCWAARPNAPVALRMAEAARSTAGATFTEFQLEPLPRTQGDQLLRNLLGRALPPSVNQAILDKADGNPFFVEEVIRGMIDCGAVVQDRAGVWQATAEAEEMTIPDTVQGVIMARIDRLDEDLKRVLRLASVIGRSFFLRVLKTISEEERSVDSGVVELTDLELLREKARAPELEFMFRHALVQETAYETIVRRRRRELHRRVAEAIEALFAERLEEFYGLLAYHAARGEDWERAQRYLLKAGDQAARLAADAEALAHYQHAAEACERAFGDEWEPAQRAALDQRIGEALFRSGQFPEAIRFLTRALECFGRRYPKTRPELRRAIAAELVQQSGRRQLPGLFRKKPRESAFARERSEIYSCLAWIHYFTDQESLALDALANLNEAEGAGDPVGTARGLMAVGMLFNATGLHRVAERYHREAVATARRASQPVALGQAQLGMGMHQFDLGDWDGCERVMEAARAAYMEAGDLRGWGAASAWIFWIAAYRGDFAAALEVANAMARYGDEAADGQLQRFGLHYRGAALSRSGNLEEAVQCLERALARYEAVPEVIGMAHAAGDLGLCYARLGDLTRALDLLEHANRELDDRGLRAGGCVPPRAALAEVYALAAEAASGEERKDLLRKCESAAAASHRLGRLHHESLIFAHRTAGTHHWLGGRPAAARANWKKALTLAEKLRARYEVARTLQEIGRHTADRALLTRAQALFAEISSRWEEARTRDLLLQVK